MKTLTTGCLTRSNWLIAATSYRLVGLVLSSAAAHAQVQNTCADLQWPTGTTNQSQPPSTADPEKLKIPANLPTLGEAVQQLNPRAIALSWQVLAGLSLKQLKDGCSAAVKRLVLNGEKQ